MQVLISTRKDSPSGFSKVRLKSCYATLPGLIFKTQILTMQLKVGQVGRMRTAVVKRRSRLKSAYLRMGVGYSSHTPSDLLLLAEETKAEGPYSKIGPQWLTSFPVVAYNQKNN